MQFFLGLALVLRSHDQIPATHWSILLPYHCPLPMQFSLRGRTGAERASSVDWCDLDLNLDLDLDLDLE